MSSQEVQKFENDNIALNVAISPGCLVKFECTANPPFVLSAYKEAINRVRREVSLPGFRKGKAPDAIVLKHYAKAVDGEWKDLLLNNAFQEAINLSFYAPLKAAAKQIKSSIKSISIPQAEAQLIYEFESVPRAPSIDVQTLSLEPVTEREVAESAIEEKIEQARLSLASWEEIKDRKAEEGDFVRLDLEEIREGQPHPDFTDRRFEIVEGKMSAWLRDLVIGLSAGESKEGMSKPDEALDLDQETKNNFKPSLFKVTLRAIEKAITPELDEAFAKRLGVQTMDEVKSVIKKQLERQSQLEKRERQLKQLEEKLVNSYSFDLPRTLLQKDTQNILQNQLARLSEEERTQKQSDLEKDAAHRAIKQLTLYYLMRQFNDDHKIKVTNDDLNREISKLLQQFPQEMLPEIAKSLNEEFYSAVLSEVTVRKGLDHLLKEIA